MIISVNGGDLTTPSRKPWLVAWIWAGVPWVPLVFLIEDWLNGENAERALVVGQLAIAAAMTGSWVMSKSRRGRQVIWWPALVGGLVHGVSYGIAFSYGLQRLWLAVAGGLLMGVLATGFVAGMWHFWITQSASRGR